MFFPHYGVTSPFFYTFIDILRVKGIVGVNAGGVECLLLSYLKGQGETVDALELG